MLGPGDVISALETFQLELLEESWVAEIWRDKFGSCPEDLPDEFAEKFSILNHTSILDIMHNAMNVIEKWLQATESQDVNRSQGSDAGASWTALQEIDHKALLAMIFFYAKKAHENNQNMACVQLGITTAKFYFHLLMIPGSSVYNIFQFSLYEVCLDLVYPQKYLGKSIATGSKGRRRPTADDEDDVEVEFSLGEQKSILKMLLSLTSTFQTLLKRYSFKSNLEALKFSMTIFSDLTRYERQASVEMFSQNMDKSSLMALAKEAYITLGLFCTELQGRVSETVRLILFRLMPNLRMIGGSAIPDMEKWPPKEQANVRAYCLWFIRTQLIPLGPEVLLPLKILIQQLCRGMLDRADYRSKATDTVIAIISLLPQDAYYSILKWMFREVINEGANHRVIALEMLSKLIYLKQGSPERSNMTEATQLNAIERSQSAVESMACQSNVDGPGDATENQNENQTNADGDRSRASESSVANSCVLSFCKAIEYVPIEYRRAMLVIIIDRLRDEAATVRTRCLSILSEIVSNRRSPTVMSLVRDIFSKPYARLAEIDLMTDEPGFVKGNVFAVALDKIAQQSVCDSVQPGGRSIVKLVLRNCNEHRVSVRKAAITFLVEIFRFNPKWMTKDTLTPFGLHCRDLAMSIRKDMVTYVTDLMLEFPSNRHLGKIWVEEVMTRIKDKEIRVHEHTLQVLTKTILMNIKAANNTHTATDRLPWQLLSHIADNKMRCFLTEACLTWRKSRIPELNNFKINTIMTHIGNEHNSACWILLASLSEYMDLENPDKVMEYYENVVVNEKMNDATPHLVLTTLKNCCHKLRKEKQLELLSGMEADMKSAKIEAQLLPIVVEIATSIMVTTAADEDIGRDHVGTWAYETSQMCEHHLEDCLRFKREICPKCDFHVILLGCSSDVHPDGLSKQTFHQLYEFLMAHGRMTDDITKIKAALILTLSKAALRNKEFTSTLVAGLSEILSSYKSQVLLNNAVVAVADLCTRHPDLISPLIPSLSLCLRHKNYSVREITLVMLIDLIQEGYVKAKGSIITHLLTLLADPYPRTVSITKYFVERSLLPKLQSTLDQMLVVTIFHLNKYYDHPNYPRPAISENEERVFDMSGALKHKSRMCIYQFLVNNFNVIGKHKATTYICNTILNGVAEKVISLTNPLGEQLLLDSLILLCSKVLKPGDSSSKKGDEEEGGGGGAENDRQAIQEKAMEALMKASISGTIIPICSKLRKVLSGHKLCKLLYRFVRELVREYKNEIASLFRDDSQFGQEILYEINHIAAGQEEEVLLEEPPVQSEVNAEVVQAEVRGSVEGPAKRKSDRMSEDEDRPNQEQRKKRRSESHDDAMPNGHNEVADLPRNDQLVSSIARININDENNELNRSGLRQCSIVLERRDSVDSIIDRPDMPPPDVIMRECRVRLDRRDSVSSVGSSKSERENNMADVITRPRSVRSTRKDSVSSTESSSRRESFESDAIIRACTVRLDRRDSVSSVDSTSSRQGRNRSPAGIVVKPRLSKTTNDSAGDRAKKGSVDLGKLDRFSKSNDAIPLRKTSDKEKPEKKSIPRKKKTSQDMPPPEARRSRASGRRTPVTPSLAKNKPNLLSSTPLSLPSSDFDDSDISPVVEPSRAFGK